MKSLFRQLSEENQEKLINSKNDDLIFSLQCKHWQHYLTIKDMMGLSEVLGVDYFKLGTVLNLFKY
jgi:hypothetical protein